MNYSIDKHQIIITQDTDNYTLLAGLPRDGSEFESYDYWSCVNKLKEIVEKLKEVVVNTYLLSFEEEAASGSTVEIEDDGETDNVIKWLRWNDAWYIMDIFNEPIN